MCTLMHPLCSLKDHLDSPSEQYWPVKGARVRGYGLYLACLAHVSLSAHKDGSGESCVGSVHTLPTPCQSVCSWVNMANTGQIQAISLHSEALNWPVLLRW